MTDREPITYEQTGVSYADMDPFKVAAQEAAATTDDNMTKFGHSVVSASRGESAFVWDEGSEYRAMVTEGLGTKNLVADAFSELGNGSSYYDKIAKDTIAMIVNDLVVVGAEPHVVTAHFSVGDSAWFEDRQRSTDLVKGWAAACDEAGAVWGGGETPTLKGIVEPGKIELSGSATGIINPKERLTLGEKLEDGDAIILLESSGIHANGLTLARTIADNLPNGYATELSDGTPYGEALLAPTHIYVQAVRALFEGGVDIHYMANITGHGWRKLMRANRDDLGYAIIDLPSPQPVFNFLQEHSGNDDQEMYGNFNMGAGYAVFLNRTHINRALTLLERIGTNALLGGFVFEGPKRVLIEPKGLAYEGESLEVR